LWKELVLLFMIPGVHTIGLTLKGDVADIIYL
jgi:hypothetical protein